MRADYFSPDIVQFLALLAKHRVRYLVIGGEAVIHHGYPSLTGDIDFYYERTSENIAQLDAVLVEFWEGAVPALGAREELLQPGLVLQFGRPPNRIDLINALGTVEFAGAWDRRVTTTIDSDAGAIPVHFIGLADLITSKREAGRHKDLDDLDHLLPQLES